MSYQVQRQTRPTPQGSIQPTINQNVRLPNRIRASTRLTYQLFQGFLQFDSWLSFVDGCSHQPELLPSCQKLLVLELQQQILWLQPDHQQNLQDQHAHRSHVYHSHHRHGTNGSSRYSLRHHNSSLLKFLHHHLLRQLPRLKNLRPAYFHLRRLSSQRWWPKKRS